MTILIMLACSILWRLGGWRWKWCRRIIVPVSLALYLSITLKTWWLFFAVGMPLGLTIPIGYGEPTPDDPKPSFLGQIFRKGWLIRGIYGAIVAGSGSLGLLVTKYIGFSGYFIYIVLNFTIGAVLCRIKAPDWLVEPLIGAGVALLVLLT